MSFNAPLYSAGLAAAGLGFSSMVGRASKKAYRGPTAVVPVSRQAVQDSQIASLRKMITMNKQQISNYYAGGTIAVTGGIGNTGYDINVTNTFVASTDYAKQVLGDKYLNKMLHLKFDSDGLLPKVRIVVYWCKRSGNSSAITDFTALLDPAAHVVLYDRTHFPILSQGNTPLFPSNIIRIPLKNKLTTYNFSSSVLEAGDLRIRVVAYNDNAAGRSIVWNSRLFIANK